MALREGLLEELVSTGIWLQASDIHFDPTGEAIRLIYRIHGRLIAADAVSHLPHETSRAIVSRLKVLARMQLGEQRRGQDGHVRLETARGICDLRVATVPTLAGERAVVRLFPEEHASLQLHELGMPHAMLSSLQRIVQEGAGGIVLVAGKIGAGKSTTLHALMREHVTQGASVITIEDPVERRVYAFHQMAVDDRLGWSFSECLRAALRQDPDWLMIGEIRDAETAHIAVRAGLTGHLIAATVHADDARQALLRLVELGVAPSLVAQSVRLVVWQRLAEVLCDHCQGSGCEQCAGVGVTGRKAEFQVLDRMEAQRFLLSPERVDKHDPRKPKWSDERTEVRHFVSASRLPRRVKRGVADEGLVVAESPGVFTNDRRRSGRLE